jgi:hypothetical protein
MRMEGLLPLKGLSRLLSKAGAGAYELLAARCCLIGAHFLDERPSPYGAIVAAQRAD